MSANTTQAGDYAPLPMGVVQSGDRFPKLPPMDDLERRNRTPVRIINEPDLHPGSSPPTTFTVTYYPDLSKLVARITNPQGTYTLKQDDKTVKESLQHRKSVTDYKLAKMKDFDLELDTPSGSHRYHVRRTGAFTGAFPPTFTASAK